MAIEKFEEMSFDSKEIRSHAMKFDKKVFREEIIEFIEKRI
ncbi:hypothetical protein ACFLY2_01880 [Patescibacteria group bacterium]